MSDTDLDHAFFMPVRDLDSDLDPADLHLLQLLGNRAGWIRECEERFKELRDEPPHFRGS